MAMSATREKTKRPMGMVTSIGCIGCPATAARLDMDVLHAYFAVRPAGTPVVPRRRAGRNQAAARSARGVAPVMSRAEWNRPPVDENLPRCRKIPAAAFPERSFAAASPLAFPARSGIPRLRALSGRRLFRFQVDALGERRVQRDR